MSQPQPQPLPKSPQPMGSKGPALSGVQGQRPCRGLGRSPISARITPFEPGVPGTFVSVSAPRDVFARTDARPDPDVCPGGQTAPAAGAGGWLASGAKRSRGVLPGRPCAQGGESRSSLSEVSMSTAAIR